MHNMQALFLFRIINISYNDKEVRDMNVKIKNIFGKKEPSVLMDLLSSPDDHTYTMEVEDGEVVIRIKKKETKDEG